MMLTGNQLKCIAMAAMLCDHVGKELLPQSQFLQIIGRLAFPIFAYFIAEGCRYTRSRGRYLATMLGLGLACQVVYVALTGDWYCNVLLTFALSILMIYSGDSVLTSRRAIPLLLGSLLLGLALTLYLPYATAGKFQLDYGLWGVLLPVAVYYTPGRREKLIAAGVMLCALSLTYGGIQWYCFGALVLLALYRGKRGKRGKWNIKYVFYAFYPLHLAVIQLIKWAMER